MWRGPAGHACAGLQVADRENVRRARQQRSALPAERVLQSAKPAAAAILHGHACWRLLLLRARHLFSAAGAVRASLAPVRALRLQVAFRSANHGRARTRFLDRGNDRYTGTCTLLLCIASFCAGSFSDPGFVTDGNLRAHLAAYPYDNVTCFKKECWTCHRPRPARSKHCGICGGWGLEAAEMLRSVLLC